MFDNGDLDRQIACIYACKPLPEAQVITLCENAKIVLADQSNIVPIRAPVIICGDTHGQFYDLMELFEIGGKVPDSNYLFLGDYVNRGHHSVETITLLIALKLRYKDRITLLRGNHESRHLSQTYGFYDECRKKYGSSAVWKCFTDLFDYLPLATVVDDKILCLHGGLSPQADSLNDIRELDRFKEITHQGIMTNLLWTDPDERNGWHVAPESYDYSFGPDITEKFIHNNNLKMIARAHRLMPKGYEVMHNGNLVSLFSAPNYCYRCANQAAIMDVDENLEKTYIQFDPSPKTYPQNLAQGYRSPDYFL